jgi:uncharacterized membrane protein (UPF0182 family)
MEYRKIETSRRRPGLALILALVVIFSLVIRWLASYAIEYQWWKEMGQVPTWLNMLWYGVAPAAACAIIFFGLLWAAHARGLRLAGVRLREHGGYARLTTLAALLLGILLAAALIDNWTAVRFFGNLGAPQGEWRDPVFQRELGFYLFDLPFWQMLLRVALVIALLSGFVYWATARIWQLRLRFAAWQSRGEIPFSELGLSEGLESVFLRSAAVIFLLALAAHFYLGRFDLLLSEHSFMVGADYVDETIRIPLVWLSAGACVVAAGFVWLGRWKWILMVPAALILEAVVPKAVNWLYVRPNEISIQRPYIQRHIRATRAAFGLDHRSRELEFPARMEARIDPAKHKALFDNVRLWDWRAFHDTVTQIQALRPYYVFPDTDVDRYHIQGQLRQVLLAPRELDIRQLPDARTRWINPHFIYTHGYGLVMAEAARITPDGLPALLIQDAPPKVDLPGFELKRPEIYYGEVVHEPVFVRTGQPEFNYPSGSDNVHTHYEGTGGFPVSSFVIKLAAALQEADWNILLTDLLKGESRMMIRRKVTDRVKALAGFLDWDIDPYLVVTRSGRLVWMLDGYTTTSSHPYSRPISVQGIGRFNYIRNAVKATIDAYDGAVRLYIFEPADPIIQAYSRLFPKLFLPAAEMPEDLRAHARYPELIFRAQAEAYRVFHMTDPEAFYNKEDVWDVAKNIYGQGNKAELLAPTYVVATLPGEEAPEFLLMLPFTPRGKDNLIGLMVARCDGPHLGELVFLQLSKQALIFGPMQIEARINQDQNISKDLTLWNQQGSQVLRGQMLVLPIEDSFLYVESIYIQASEARMPQLKKVVLAMGNILIYTDTYEEGLAQLAGLKPTGASAAVATAGKEQVPPSPRTPEAEKRLEALRARFQRYRDLMAQGKWAEAGRELEGIAAELSKK